MNWHTWKKTNKAIRRTFTLLLAALMLSSSVFAAGVSIVQSGSGQHLAWDNEGQEYTKYLKETYGKDWEKVAALQPGDSYISSDFLYVCTEETYVKWKRVKTAADLNTSDWGGKEHLLLMTSTDGKKVYVGNDFANCLEDIDHAIDTIGMHFDDVSRTRKVISGITRDTSGNGTAEYVEEYVYPELNEFVKNSTGGYPYPDTFQTAGTMNAPYVQDAGLDQNNGNQRKLKVILSKDDGSMSGIGMSYRWTYEGAIDGWDFRIELKPVRECNGYTFHLENGKLRIFENIPDDDDLQIRVFKYDSKTHNEDLASFDAMLYGARYGDELKNMPATDLVIYIGEKTVGKRIEVTSLALEDAEQNPEALENVYGGAIEFYHWEKITSGSQLPTGNDTYRALLVWDDKYFLQGDDFRRKSGADTMALYVNEEKTNSAVPGNVAEVPEIDLSKNEFYTMGGLGTPYLKFSYKDTDSDNDYCPYYTFQLAGMDDQPSRKWLCDGDNILDICLDDIARKRYGGMDVGIIVGREGDSDNDSAPGKVKCFFNESGGKDTGFMYSGNIFYAESSGIDWGYSQFTLYIGKPVVYPAVRQNYVVGEDQFMHISQNGAMLKNVTITVAKGGVLSIESWFMNNGRIIVDGGTLIVQEASNPLGDELADDTEDSVMMPFADIHPLVSGSLELRNGGELIIMDNTRAAFSNIKATTGSSILNCGILLAETIDLHSATLEIRKNSAVLAGYDFREMTSFRTDDLITDGNGNAKMPQMVSRLQSNVACFFPRMYSSIHNDGCITYSTRFSSVTHGSANATGRGVYYKLPGDKSRYMLSS